MSKSFLYVGMYYDIFENRDIGIKDKKIGITTNPNNRENSLNATKGPIGYMFIKLYECEGEITADNIESIFHTLLEDRNTHGEWYKDEDEIILDSVSSVINNLKNLGVTIKEIDLGLDPNLSKVEKEQIQRAKNSKMKLMYNHENLSSRFAVETYLKGIKIISDIVGWDRIIEEGECDIFRTTEELYERFPTYRERDAKVYEKVDDYYVWTNLNNDNKLKRLNKLISKFDIVGITCTIDL
jgi:hypothetical protein